jgi:hypothetical protein
MEWLRATSAGLLPVVWMLAAGVAVGIRAAGLPPTDQLAAQAQDLIGFDQ